MKVSSITLVALTGAAIGFASQPSVLDTVINAPAPIMITTAGGEHDVVKSRFLMVSRIARFPAGFEQAVDTVQKTPATVPTDLRGMTARQALEALVTADPRYVWRDMSDVVVMRPKSMWADCSHFLNREVSFERTGLTVTTAARALQHLIDPAVRERRSPELPGFSGRSFSIDVAHGTLLQVFNLTAAQGQLAWSISYGKQQADSRWIELSLQTFDGQKVGWAGELRPLPAQCQ